MGGKSCWPEAKAIGMRRGSSVISSSPTIQVVYSDPGVPARTLHPESPEQLEAQWGWTGPQAFVGGYGRRGDLFVCRVAGNFANDDTVASLEYGVAVLNSPLILVLGHDSCGAVDATIKSLKDNTTLPGHLPSLVTALAASVKASADQPGDKLANAIRQNVKDVTAKLKAATPILSAALCNLQAYEINRSNPR